MCGRYVSASTPDEIAAYFDAEIALERAIPPSWNVAPTDDVYVVRERDGRREVHAHHWGLVPFWAKDPKVGARMINARAEGLAEKGAFKHALRHRRCIVPADGFYEWEHRPGSKVKQPWLIAPPTGELLAFAGLWESWSPERGSDDRLLSTTIITTAPNAAIEHLHDRMPAILPETCWDLWLDPAVEDPDELASVLVPAPNDLLTLRPVSTDVNSVKNQGPHLIDPVDPALPGGLFGTPGA